MISIKRYRILLAVYYLESLTVLDITINARWGCQKMVSVPKACFDLYRAGYLERKETPSINIRGESLPGGHKYKYYLTKKGKERVKWFREQGYS